MSVLLQVSDGSTDTAMADVVFVHGIQGDPRETWTNKNGGFWPSWLAEDNAGLAVWSVGYEAGRQRVGRHRNAAFRSREQCPR
jgi:hypothetical protein